MVTGLVVYAYVAFYAATIGWLHVDGQVYTRHYKNLDGSWDGGV